jgi:hypothetical protein
MTTFIYDNGRDYSDHEIVFVEVNLPEGTDLKRAGNAINFILSCRYGYYSQAGKILGVGEFSWWQGSAMTFAELLKLYPDAQNAVQDVDPDDAKFPKVYGLYKDALWLREMIATS